MTGEERAAAVQDLDVEMAKLNHDPVWHKCFDGDAAALKRREHLRELIGRMCAEIAALRAGR